MDKKYGTAALVAIIIISLYFVFRSFDNSVAMKVVTVSEENDTYEIHVEYPQFPQAEESFNEKIETTINEAVAEFKNYDFPHYREDSSASSPRAPFFFRIHWKPDQINEGIVSFSLHASYYTGGAHGGRDIYTFNYDFENEEEITLDRVFGGSPRYLERVSQYAIHDLKSQLSLQIGSEPPLELIAEGASPRAENFSRFTIGPGEIISFYFTEYQVAAYAAGELQVVMPISYIRSTSTLEN